MTTPCQIIVDGNPALIYASRNGSPAKILPVLERFLETFWQERELAEDHCDTPECLVAQIVVRFGFEMCEDDFSNLKVGVDYNPEAKYFYQITANHELIIWVPGSEYRANPSLGLQGCHQLVSEVCT
jgi:hypothetical protein